MPGTFRLNGVGIGLICCVALFVLGCAGAYKSVEWPQAPLEETDRIIYKDFSLQTNLSLMDILTDEVNGMLRVRAKVRNIGRGVINAEVKVKFVDKDGMEIGQGAPWIPMAIDGGEVKTFERLASSSTATDFRIIIQLAGRK